MGLFSNIKDKVTTTLQGELISELGTLPIDESGREITLSIRRHSGKEPHLQAKLAAPGGADYFKIPCSPAWADQLEKVAVEMRKHSNKIQ